MRSAEAERRNIRLLPPLLSRRRGQHAAPARGRCYEEGPLGPDEGEILRQPYPEISTARAVKPAPGHPRSAPLVYHVDPSIAASLADRADILQRIAAMGFDTVYIAPFRPDDATAARLVTAARQRGLAVMADLALDITTREAVGESVRSVVRPLLESGVEGFRCVAAHRILPDIWGALIAAVRTEAPRAFFCADTLGAPLDAAMRLRGLGFDFIFNSIAWWDWRSAWFFEQYDMLRRIAPTIGFPVPPQGEGGSWVTAERSEPARLVADYRMRYALAVSCSSGLMVPMGYEWGWRPPAGGIGAQAPGKPVEPLFDIADVITAFNTARRETPALQGDGPLQLLSPPDDPVVVIARSSRDATSWGFMLANRDANTARAVVTDALLAAAGERPLALVEAAPQDPSPVAAREIALEPMSADLLVGDAGAAPIAAERPAPAPLHPASWNAAARIAISNVSPAIDGGRFPVKRIVGDAVEVTADILRDGHDKLAAIVKYRRPDEGVWQWTAMRHLDNDRWGGSFNVEDVGRYLFAVEAWTDHFASWRSETEKKRQAGQDIAIELIEGRALVAAAMLRADTKEQPAFEALLGALDAAPPEDCADLLLSRLSSNLVARSPDRSGAVSSGTEPEIVVGREAARFAAWYEMFPRSQGRIPGQSATFDDCIARLPEIAELGFDVVYLVPIHPIGRINRKGRDNAVTAAPGDPGSPYAIGAAEGGHCAVHPELGTIEDFRRFVAAAASLGMEVALDFAVQCAPDHPWTRDHPQWFVFRPDGTIKYAENPPKKYQDIVNVDFYNADREALWRELRDVILFWAREGVRIFRVDNPHTKPVPFWEWCIREVQAEFPDTIFLSEAFTRPKVMKLLAQAGFTQSYSYFTWRNTKHELIEYLTELTRGTEREYMQPNFFTNTPDILPRILQDGGRPAFRSRLVLAATLSPAYGIYNGFELCENTAIPGTEEYLHSEKYEYKVWDWDRPGNIKAEIAALNRFRRENPALRLFANLVFCDTTDENILAYVKQTPGRGNIVLIVVNLDPFAPHEAVLTLPLYDMDIGADDRFHLDEALSGVQYDGRGAHHRFRLDPEQHPALVFRLTRR